MFIQWIHRHMFKWLNFKDNERLLKKKKEVKWNS